MQRFFVDPAVLQSPTYVLPALIVHQLTHVLRARQGDHIVLLDNSGYEYETELVAVTPRKITAATVNKTLPEREPRLRLVLCQALIRENKFDWVLQKGTEVGISAFVPIICERSLNGVPGPNKYERWRRIITEAAEQSGRTCLPSLEQPIALEAACTSSQSFSLFASPQQAMPLSQALAQASPNEIRLFIGPEGGFSEAETEYARQQGLAIIQLGKRILRTETAGLVAAAAIMFRYGEI